jgi:hypothetical protein
MGERRAEKPCAFRQRPAPPELKLGAVDLSLTLQLHSSFQMCALYGGLMGPSPRQPGDDMSRLNAPLREPGGDAANFLHGPADQGFGFACASLAADFSGPRLAR